MRRIMTIIAVAMAGLAACEGGADSRETRARGEGGGQVLTDTISDAQIASLVALINGSEIAAARAVQSKLASAEVRAFAGSLIEDHTRMTEAMPSFEGPDRPPQQFLTLNAVFRSQAHMLATLPAGYPFDATFVAAQVGNHAMAVDSLWRWHGIASSPGLKSALSAAIPVVESHLQRAKELYARLDRRVDLGRPGPAETVPPSTAPGPATVPADTASQGSDDTHGGHTHGG
jgi:putative membrane protein